MGTFDCQEVDTVNESGLAIKGASPLGSEGWASQSLRGTPLTRHDDPPNARATFLVTKRNNGKMMPLYGVKSMLLFDSERCKNGT
jgi:hypothetical protein